MSERVALYDPDDPQGRVVGAASRERMRRENLPHGAASVLVRRGSGEVFVHRRSEAKDVWPGHHDCFAGGVIGAGEDPDVAVRRELAEELGIAGVEPAPVLRRWFHDEQVRALSFVYAVVWDGAVRFADGEVAAGRWERPDRLYERLQDPSWPFVPDGRELLGLPAIEALLRSAPGA